MSSHEALAADRFFLPIHVQVFPGAEKSLMSRGAALHLYRLLQQYAWCLAVDDYAIRWVTFWPSLKPVERAILIHTVKSHCDGEFGRRLVVAKLPVDFEFYESDTRSPELAADVESEFEGLLEEHSAIAGGNDQIRSWVADACPVEYNQFVHAGALDRVFGTAAWVCPSQLRARSLEILRQNGTSEWYAACSAAAVEKAVWGFYEGCGAPL